MSLCNTTSRHICFLHWFSLLITLNSGTVGSVKPPSVNKHWGELNQNETINISRKSYWTNSNPKQNGGTLFMIKDYSHDAVGLSTITVNYTLCIIKFGTTDLTLDLSLDDWVIPA